MQSQSENGGGDNDDGVSRQSFKNIKTLSPSEDHRGNYLASTQMSQSSPLKIEGEHQHYNSS